MDSVFPDACTAGQGQKSRSDPTPQNRQGAPSAPPTSGQLTDHRRSILFTARAESTRGRHQAATFVADNEDGDSSSSAHRALTQTEFRELWRSARWPLIVLLDLCGRNGLRPSGARALRWTQVDLDARTLTVNRQMSSENRPTAAKTKRSVRTIPVDDRTAHVLKTWRGKQETKRAGAGERWKDLDLVVSTRYGTGINAANFRRMLGTACDEC